MSEYRAMVVWERQGTEFKYKTYTRDHVWKFEGPPPIEASAAAAYLGNPERLDPEKAFVASLSSCHMLTFLALAARDGFVVERYVDDAVGTLARNHTKRMAMTRVVLRPHVVWQGASPRKDTLAELHRQAHLHCFISNSVQTEIEIEPRHEP